MNKMKMPVGKQGSSPNKNTTDEYIAALIVLWALVVLAPVFGVIIAILPVVFVLAFIIRSIYSKFKAFVRPKE